MAVKNESARDEELNIPRVEIKIRRMGEWMQFEIGNYKFKAKEIGNCTYDLVSIEQFLTLAAKKAYENIVKNEQVKKDLASLKEDWDKK